MPRFPVKLDIYIIPYDIEFYRPEWFGDKVLDSSPAVYDEPQRRELTGSSSSTSVHFSGCRGLGTIRDDLLVRLEVLESMLKTNCLESRECGADAEIEFEAGGNGCDLTIVKEDGMLSCMNDMSSISHCR
jgi:hypothetical protein